MAALPLSRAWVGLGPPLSWSGPSRASALIRSPSLGVALKPQLLAESRLFPKDVIAPAQLAGPLPLSRVFSNRTVPPLRKTPPPETTAALLAMVTFVSELCPAVVSRPPPLVVARLPLSVTLVRPSVPPWWSMPAPLSALLPRTVLSDNVRRLLVPLTRTPPPDCPDGAAPPGSSAGSWPPGRRCGRRRCGRGCPHRRWTPWSPEPGSG